MQINGNLYFLLCTGNISFINLGFALPLFGKIQIQRCLVIISRSCIFMQNIFHTNHHDYMLLHLDFSSHLSCYNISAVVLSSLLQVNVIISNLFRILNWTIYPIMSQNLLVNPQTSILVIHKTLRINHCLLYPEPNSWQPRDILTGRD